MEISNRIKEIKPYLFMEISRKIAAKRAEGADVISFGIGDPDIPTPDHIVNSIIEASKVSANHRYPESDGLPEFRKVISEWYNKRFSVSLNPNTEIVPLIGAKEGIAHFPLCVMNPGEIGIVPDPGYPVYSIGNLFAGGETFYAPLKEENEWLVDLEAIPSEIAKRAKLMWLCYPNNPTGAIASAEYFESAVKFCKQNDIILCHDACYSEIAYDGYKPISLMEIDGAKDISIEFHSLSKSYNMTGWRAGMAVGNEELIKVLTIVKSNIDSGIPQAIQYGAMEALTASQECIQDNIDIYTRRRDKVINALQAIGLEIVPPKAGLYIWVRIPKGFTSAEFATALLDEKDLVVTPGSGYGEYGEGYIRFSLTLNDSDLDRGIDRLSTWNIPSK
jgi:LL-diaminopimelate aminotransferase